TVRHHRHRDVDGGRAGPLAGADDAVTARYLTTLDAHEVERDPAPGQGPSDLTVSRLDGADPSRQALRTDFDLVVDRDDSAPQCPGHDGSGAASGEDPVDPDPGPAEVGRLRCGGEDGIEGAPHVLDAPSRERVARH